MKKIVFPEGNNDFIKQAAKQLETICQPILLEGGPEALATASNMLQNRQADAMIAGIDCPTRDVVIASRDIIGLPANQKTFASLFVCDFPDGRRLILADGATCKNPTAEQLADIIYLTHQAAEKILDQVPKVAMLSFSTFGSGGTDPSIDKIHQAMQFTKARLPQALIDGEMQLDAAINPRIGHKKAPNSPVAGQANVLIVPDLNSGNILYKAIEQLAGAHVAGPVLLGFNQPISDLSRGSTVDDVILTAKILLKIS